MKNGNISFTEGLLTKIYVISTIYLLENMSNIIGSTSIPYHFRPIRIA